MLLINHKGFNIKKYKLGFTLIEILIALVIISLATTALMTALSSNIRNAEKLIDKTEAHFLAQNLMNSLQLRLLSMKLANGKMSGSKPMGKKTWNWTITVKTDTLKNITNVQIYKIKVDIYKENNKSQVIDSVTSYAPIYQE